MATLEATRHQGTATKPKPAEVRKLIALMKKNREFFTNSDRSFSPDRFDSLRLMLLREFDLHCMDAASVEFLREYRQTRAR